MIEGLAQFPCAADKRPLTPHGFKDATRNIDTKGWPLIGIPTGKVNGVDVIDIDPAGMDWYSLNFDAIPSTRVHSTPRGLHLFFKHVDGMGCSAGRIAPG